jgi:hypothetical protein
VKVTIDLAASASAGAKFAIQQNDACPDDPDGVHFVGCGCDYASPDDPGPEPEWDTDAGAAAVAT